MKFYDREKEIEVLRKFSRIAVIGRRRIGKTRLVEETFKDKVLTLFIPAEKREKLVCNDWIREVREHKLYIPELTRMKDVVEYLMVNARDYVIFLDELQNTLKVNKAFLYDLQRLMDKHREAKIVVSGSIISMSKKVIEEYKSPLYGRFDAILKLKELSFPVITEICRDLKLTIEDALTLYSVFGGIPKYYETLEKSRMKPLNFIYFMFFEDPYPLVEDVRMMLREEFGKEYKTYFSVLEAISNSKNTLGEICGYLGVEANKITKYIYNLEREYEIIIKHKPVIGRGKAIYEIEPNLTDFWFKFIWKHYPNILRNGEAKEYFQKNFNKYLSMKFEKTIRELIKNNVLKLPFKQDTTGKWWGHYREGKKKRSFEVDIAALNNKKDKVALIEVKWSKLTEEETLKIIKETKEKQKHIPWKAEVYIGVIAREIMGKKRIREKGFIAYDLKDIEETLER